MSIFFAQPVEQMPFAPAFTGVTATNEDPLYPATNLLSMDPTKVFKTTTGTTVITFNMTSTFTYFDIVSLVYTNTSYRATLLVEDTANGGTSWNTLYSGPLWANLIGTQATSITNPGSSLDPRLGSLRRNHSLYVRTGSAPGSNQVRLTVTDPLVSLITIGRLFVGRKFVPSTGWQYGSSFNFIDLSKRDRTDRGALIVETGDVIFQAQVKLDFLNKAEMYDYVYEFNYWRGSGREIMACLDVEDTARLQKNIMYAMIAEGRQISFDAYNTHSQTWTLESIA